jgi:hypothetical protein
VHGFAGWQSLKLGDVVLDDEETAGFEVRGGVAKGRHLFLLGRQVRDRVAQEVHEPERRAHRRGREIADGHVDVLSRASLGHRLGQLDPLYANASPAQRHRDAARADAEFEGGTTSRQLRQEAHGGIHHRGLEQFGPQSLVPFGYPVGEEHLRHGRSITPIAASGQANITSSAA